MPIPFIIGGLLAGATIMGAGMSWAASETNKEAQEMLEDAQYKYDNKKSEFDKKQTNTQNELERLARLKTDVWVGFDRFIKAFESIKNKPTINGSYSVDELNISTGEFIEEIKTISINATNIIAGITAGCVATTVLGGIGLSGITCVLGAGSVEAISTTISCGIAAGGAGAAATLAEIIPGVAIITAPVLFVSGLKKIDQSTQNQRNAEKTQKEVDEACNSMDKSIQLFSKIKKCSKSLYGELKALYEIYQQRVTQLENLILTKSNYSEFTNEEKQLLNANILLVKLLKELTQVEIVKVKSEDKTQYVDDTSVKTVIESCKQKRLALNY